MRSKRYMRRSRRKSIRRRKSPKGGLFGFGFSQENQKAAIEALRQKYPDFNFFTREEQDNLIQQWISENKTVTGRVRGTYNSIREKQENENIKRGYEAFKQVKRSANIMYAKAVCEQAPAAARRAMGGISGILTKRQNDELQILIDNEKQFCDNTKSLRSQ